MKYFVAQTHDRPRGGRAKIIERMGFLVLFHPKISISSPSPPINSASSLFYGASQPASHIRPDGVRHLQLGILLTTRPLPLSLYHSYLIHSHLIKMFGLRAWPTPVRSPSCGNPHDPVSSKHSTDTHPLLFFSPVYSSPDPWLPSSPPPSSPTWESPSCRTWPSTVRLSRRRVLKAELRVLGSGYRRAG